MNPTISDTLLPEGKKIYFASDFHLGIPNEEESLKREKRIVQWLTDIAPTAHEIFLVGDIFDFWFEYKHAIPRGYTRLLGKIAELTDSGIPVHVFTGNHDMWMFDYLPKELGVTIFRDPISRSWNGKRFYIGHGDGLGPGDHGYKFIKKVFRNKLCQWLFARLHPNFGIAMANFWSRSSRKAGEEKDKVFLGDENEWLVIYSNEILETEDYDHFVFGHRHLPLEIKLNKGAKYTNLGDWISHYTYGEFDGQEMRLLKL
ncbi:UDP-2,3-diacylglucosamine diphosphatase [Sanyastnella coralliicola]|uniref:UDP-2,3-diacylglucosamine diphosphatase n=1 Tax=Sanyastnella coralliicola TaxID=3069118 RepID=UPI0027B89352|nr:UDP-2,3-diacylglucosamine diphosphatase [Longitalea sp. SCSIO 12813]